MPTFAIRYVEKVETVKIVHIEADTVEAAIEAVEGNDFDDTTSDDGFQLSLENVDVEEASESDFDLVGTPDEHV